MIGPSRRQIQCDGSYQTAALINIDRRLSIERHRPRHDQLRRHPVLAHLAPFDAAFPPLSPTQRRALVVEPKGTSGCDDASEEFRRWRPLAIGISMQAR